MRNTVYFLVSKKLNTTRCMITRKEHLEVIKMSNYPSVINFENEHTVFKMNEQLHETIAILKRLNIDTDELEKIQSQLYVLNLFANRQIVSIAGLQSVGKTSLVKRLLHLPEDLLESEVGVGEKRPVLISADATITEATYECVRTRKNEKGFIEIYTQSLTKEALTDGTQHPDNDMLWFEIKVPQTEKIGKLTLALLPGFERNKKSDSQQFLDLFLSCSTGMILVLNHIKLANASQHALLEKVSKNYKDKSPGFVLTFANEIDEETRKTISGNLMKQFDIDNDDQIVFSDVSDETVPAKLEKLIKQHSQYALNSESLHIHQQSLIGEKLSMALLKVEQMLQSQYLQEQDGEQFRYEERLFTSFKEKYLNTTREILKAKMDAHIEACNQQVTKSLENEQDSIGKKFKSFFKNDLTYKEVQALKKWVGDIYTTEDASTTTHLLVDAIGMSSERYLNQHLIKPTTTRTLSQPQNGKFSINMNKPKNDIIEQSNDVNQTFKMSLVTNNASQTDAQQAAPASADYHAMAINETLETLEEFMSPKKDDIVTLAEKELKVLPAIAGGLVQQAMSTKAYMDRHNLSTISELQDFNERNGVDGVEFLKQEVSQLSTDMDQLVKGAAIFFGIDSLDGTFNSFEAITGSLSALGISTGAATGIAIGGVGAIAAALAIKKGGEKLEKYKFQRDQYAKNLIQLSGEYQVESTMQALEKVFEDMESKLNAAQSNYEQAHSHLPIYNEAKIRVRRLQKQCGTLRELAYRNETFIGKLSATTL